MSSTGKLEIEYKPGQFGPVEDLPLLLKAFKSYDIVLYIDNKTGLEIEADARFWYFTGEVYNNGTLNVQIRDAKYHDD